MSAGPRGTNARRGGTERLTVAECGRGTDTTEMHTTCRSSRSAVCRLLVVLLSLSGAACVPSSPVPPLAPTAAAVGTLVHDTVEATTLQGNPLGDPLRQSMLVYLPPSYRSAPHKRYPVLHLLHGFGGSETAWLGPRAPIPAVMDSVLRTGSVREMIVVMPNGQNAYGGSFWVNSPTSGQWKDFLLRDVVRQMDRRYRTLPRATSRAIAGYSMGGYAALRLAMRYPDTFSTVYALSACCLGPELLADRQLSAAWPQTLGLQTRGEVARADFWSQFQVALASVLSPDPSHALGVAFPVAEVDGALCPVETVRARWLAATPERMVQEYRGALQRLRGNAFDVGRAKTYGVTAGCQAGPE